MKILFVDTYYPKFLNSFRKSNKNYSKYSYDNYKSKLFETCFGTSDFYSYNLHKLGFTTEDIVVNDEYLQRKWAEENKIEISENKFLAKLQTLPYIYRFIGRPGWIQDIVKVQVKKMKPDIIYMQDLSILNPETLDKVKKYCKLLVGQIASPPPPEKYLKRFDLIISSLPNLVEQFRKIGIKSEYQKLAFEPRVLKKIGEKKRKYDVTFVGSFTPYHKKGTQIFETVANNMQIDVWGQGLRYLSLFSPLKKHYHGEAWGLEMYKVFAQSKIVVNRHIGVSGDYANNMRLYEATGMGAMLITDHKKNLNDLFSVGKEVIEYKNTEDLIGKVRYYLNHEEERKKIADLGHQKTLRQHNYEIRMKQLSSILLKYI